MVSAVRLVGLFSPTKTPLCCTPALLYGDGDGTLCGSLGPKLEKNANFVPHTSVTGVTAPQTSGDYVEDNRIHTYASPTPQNAAANKIESKSFMGVGATRATGNV